MERSLSKKLSLDGKDEVKKVGMREEGKVAQDKGDNYVELCIDSFFEVTGRFDPELEERIEEALGSIIDKAYEDGVADAHLPVDDHCIVCGSYMSAE